eukprot:TRINITY_DN58609_c0_g1_i2.p1 TRINITY_DN58609_c0_g1~~TRINITY_DN58609_c0_g1_i2.p1  ORF type:complete len:240 (+),score=41.76 TRINITY_DN58609_c0_g1_i2:129-848(+)
MKKTFILILLAVTAFVAGCKSIEAVELNQKAKVYLNYGKYEQAAEIFNKSLDMYFETPSTHYWLGVCYENMNNMSKAIWEYELAIKFDPTMELAQKAYIQALVISGRDDDAIMAADSYFKRLNAPTREYIRIGKNYLDAGEEIFAVKALEYAFTNSAPPVASDEAHRDVKPLVILADYYAATGNTEKERQYLMMIFQEDSATDGVARRLGELGIKINNPRKRVPQVSPIEEDLKRLREE